MLYTIFIILSIYSISFALSQASLLDVPRNWLINKHPLFYKLFSCPYCLTTHAGWIAYLLFNNCRSYKLTDLLLWTLAAGPIGLIFNGVIDRLHQNNQRD